MTRLLLLAVAGTVMAAPALAQPFGPAQPSGTVTLRTPLAMPGATVPRTLLDKLGERLSVLDFGARCDGVTDDTAALAAAEAAGRLVEVPPGRVCAAPGLVSLAPSLFQGGGTVLLPGSTLYTPSAASADAHAQTAMALAGVSKARLLLNGGSLTVPAGTTWLALVAAQPLAAQTLVLPASPVDGQRLRISTTAAIGGLSLSPGVAGWANGSALPATVTLSTGTWTHVGIAELGVWLVWRELAR